MPSFSVADALAQLRALPAVGAVAQRQPAQGFELRLGGVVVPVLSGRVVRAIDAIAWTWAAEIAWTPGADTALDALVKPYAYAPATVKLDGVLVLTGWLYKVSPRKTVEGTTLTLEGASLTADLVDSCIPSDQWRDQWDRLSVWNLANTILPPMGIVPWTDINYADLPLAIEPFDVIQRQPTDTFADLLTRLAFQRGMLVTTNAAGNLCLTVAHVAGAKWLPKDDWVDSPGSPVAILMEGRPPATEWACVFDGRARFGHYTAIGQDGWGDVVVGEATDAVVPGRRRLAFVAGDTGKGNIGQVAAWRRSAAVAEAMSLKVGVAGWTPLHSSQLWQPNTLVTVEAPSLFIARAFTFLLRGTEHVYEANGRTAILDLVPPETYTGDVIREQWATVAPPHAPHVEGGLDL